MTNFQERLQACKDVFEDMGEGLRRNALRFGAFAGAGLTLLSMTGCAPSSRSYVSGSYTSVPKPPEAARITISISTDESDNLFINYICWDASAAKFVRRDVHYSAARAGGWAGYGNYTERGGYEQPIRDGEVLSSGVIVDQAKGKLMLPNGYVVDGTSGNVQDASGKVVKALGD